MKGRRLSLVVLAVLVMLVFGGQALFAAGSAEKKVKTFAYFIPHQGNSFMVGLAQNMIEAGKDQGVIVKVYTADNDPENKTRRWTRRLRRRWTASCWSRHLSTV